ncbi:hypothetical protein CRG98_033597 [Punica granatum]|uniref:Uncharacterized protein n=1 Tax=Punica granatum TaxID=22663 RepID=A0A2I0IPP1_PUNGR|nr:hypothetical protein CRG98_033597 [Punica granatum]
MLSITLTGNSEIRKSEKTLTRGMLRASASAVPRRLLFYRPHSLSSPSVSGTLRCRILRRPVPPSCSPGRCCQPDSRSSYFFSVAAVAAFLRAISKLDRH